MTSERKDCTVMSIRKIASGNNQKLMEVSIIIPVYQVSAYIERCLESVVNQTYTDIECIIVNDATQDDSIEKCEILIEKYDGPIHFRIIHHEINRGLSAARNTGTRAATGDYIYYLDSDDFITNDCIERLVVYALEDDTVEMVQGGHIRISDGKEESRSTNAVKVNSNEDARKLFYDLWSLHVYVWNKLIKRSFVVDNQLYCKEGILCEDSLWIFYLLKYLKVACLCEGVTYYYHIRPNSISTGSSKKVIGNHYVVIYKDILDNLSVGKESLELRDNLYGFCKKYVNCANDMPALSDVLDSYRRRARQYRCWYVCFVLTVVGLVNKLWNPLPLLEELFKIRLFIKRNGNSCI